MRKTSGRLPALPLESLPMQRSFVLLLAATAVYLPALLLADRDGWAAQLLLGLATTAFLVFFTRRSSTPPMQIVCAVTLATLGEVVLSIGWGLYTYEHALIPLYVPPGHGVFYLLASESARQEVFRRHAGGIVRAVLLAGSAVAAFSLALFADVWGLLWWIAAAALVLRSRNGLMLATCIVYTMLLEWLGTGIGNWRWMTDVPWVGLRSANPPSGVGVLYVLLDLLTVLVVGWAGMWAAGREVVAVPVRD